MLIGSRMTHNLSTIGPDIPIAEAMERMKHEKVRRFPVVDKKGRLVGIITYTDLIHASPSSATSLSIWEISYLLSQIKVSEVMTKKVITTTEDTPVEEAARLMVDHQIGGLLVMRADTLVGVITESDIFRVFLEMFGVRQKGIRLTVLAPYVKGSMAKITSAITSAGGLILAFDTFEGEDSSNWGATIKVSEIPQPLLLEAIKPLVVQIVDVREA
jgi:acetoin utilization protein AcuB